MGRVLKPIGHDERLSIVDHLDELRSRLIVSVAALLVAFGLCLWQQHRLLDVLNRPLPPSATNSKANHLNGLTGDALRESRYLTAAADNLRNLASSESLSAQDRAQFGAAAANLSRAATSLPQTDPQRLPVTIGVGEPFTTTLTVAAYFALVLALPLLIYQGYAFVVPALTQREREVLRLLADGLANEEIGKRLHISPETVRTHVRKAMSKLEADTRTQAVATASYRTTTARTSTSWSAPNSCTRSRSSRCWGSGSRSSCRSDFWDSSGWGR